jgi:hypothetical protein
MRVMKYGHEAVNIIHHEETEISMEVTKRQTWKIQKMFGKF